MFVSSVLDEWWKQFGGGCDRIAGSHRRRRYNAQRIGSPEWDEFVKQQRMVWTPPDLFEQCCPRWLASGRIQEFGHTTGATTTNPNEEDETQEWPCTGSCHKRHPSITLFFDEERAITIAVLSHRLDPFTTILDGRVDEGSATRKSPLYYELQGYLRENLSQLRRHHEHGGLGPHLVNVAMGALKKSDNVQKRKSEAAHQAQQQAIVPFDRLEEVLDIARLVRLGDDLDVMSIYSLRLASKSLGRIAARMARQRMQQAQLNVCPLVDGCSLSGGFSVFRRANTELQSIIFKMSRSQKLVEYGQCESIICCHAPQAPRVGDEDEKDKVGIYRPVETSCKEFAWNCEEISFATLDREWGDIVVHEYLGQKLVLTWHMGAADTMMIQNATSLSKSTASSIGERVPLAALPLDANLLIGSRLWELPLLHFKLDVVESDTHQTDDVTVFYKGRIRVEEIGISFLCMVRSFAKSLEPVVRERLKQIEETRPLLEHEHAYLRQVFELSAMQA